MIDLIFAAARKAAPVSHSRIPAAAPAPVLSAEVRTGVLSRAELRRAVAEVIG